MATLQAHGITAQLPTGFEGRIFTRSAMAPFESFAVAQFATFALPEQVGDFGAGAVTLLSDDDVFAVLFEYGPESLGTPLFARRGMPRQLGADQFQPYVLRRGLPGQSGTQWFFTEEQRPFTLYVVLGSHARRAATVPRVNALLAGLTVGPVIRPAVAGASWN